MSTITNNHNHFFPQVQWKQNTNVFLSNNLNE